MEFIVLGSGTSVPHPKRSSSGFWVQTEAGSLMLDFSASSIHRIAQEGLDWVNLDAVWISHFHLDHCGGLAPFLFGTKHAPDTQSRTKPLTIFGPKGVRALLETFDSAYNYNLFKQPFPLEVIEVEQLEKFQILPDLEGVALSTPHTDESHAIKIRDSNGKTLVFTADTGFAKEMVPLAKGIDLFVMECSFLRDKPVELHLELEEAMYLIRRSQPRKAMITHLYPVWDEVDAQAEIAKFEHDCEVIVAFDGLRLTI